MKKLISFLLVLSVSVLLVSSVGADGDGRRVLSYQGRLWQADGPAQGAYEFVVRLCDAPYEGGVLREIGTERAPFVAEAEDGRISLPLDIAQIRTEPSECWLEVGLRPAGSSADFVYLVPRQSLAAHAGATVLSGGEGFVLSGVVVGAEAKVEATLQPTLPIVDPPAGGGTGIAADGLVQPAPALGAGEPECLDGPTVDNDAICATDGGDVLISAGSLGIGTAAPQNPLQVSRTGGLGTGLADGVHLGLDSTGTAHLELVTDGGNPYIDFLNDNANDQDARIILQNDNALSILGADVGIGITPAAGAALDVAGNIRTDGQLISTVATGTAPFSIASTTLVPNLNADLLDGMDSTAFAAATHMHTGADIVDGSLTTDDLADNAVTNAKMADNSVGSAEIIDGSVMTDDLANDSVTSAKILDGEVMTDDIANDAVTNAKMADNSVGSAEIINDSIIAEDLASDADSLNKVSGGAMNSDGTNIGIGTATPAEALDVVGNVNVSGTVFADFLSSHSPLQLQTAGTTRVFIDDVTGFVGVNTMTPGELLDVVGGNIRTDGSVLTTMVDSGMAADLALKTNGSSHIIINEATGFVGLGPVPPNPATEALEVDGCVKAECFITAGDSTIDVSPLKIVRAGISNVNLLPNLTGSMTVRFVTTGSSQFVMAPIEFPARGPTVVQKLKSVSIRYRVSSPTSFVTSTRIKTLEDAGTATVLFDDPTDRNSTFLTTYTLAPAVPADVPGPTFIEFGLSNSGTGSAHDIEIGKIVVTTFQE